MNSVSNGEACATGEYLTVLRAWFEADVDPALANELAEQIQRADDIATARRNVPRAHSGDAKFYHDDSMSVKVIRTIMRVCGHQSVTITRDGVTYE